MTPRTSAAEKQAMLLDYIKFYSALTGYPPTYAEIGRALGITKSLVHYHLRRLAEQHRLTVDWGHSRAIRIVEAG